MNKIYKVIWNRVRHCYVVVSEIAKNHGKEHSTNLRVSKGLCALTLAIGLSLSSYAFAADPVDLGNSGSAAYDNKHNLTIGNQVQAVGDKQEGQNNTAIGTNTDTLRNVKEGDATKNGQPMDTDANTRLVDGEGTAHKLDTSTESGGSTAVGYNNKAEGDNSTAIGNTAKITNKPITYYADADGNKTTDMYSGAWYKDNNGNPTRKPHYFRDANDNQTTTPQYKYTHTVTAEDGTTSKVTDITTDLSKADKNDDGTPVYNYRSYENTDYLYSVQLYQSSKNSIAAGTNVTANGSSAVAVGDSATADGNSTIAIGKGAKATDTSAGGTGSIAIGKGVEANGSSTAVGLNGTKATYGSSAYGNNAAAQNSSAAFGSNIQASNGSYASGNNVVAQNSSAAFGSNIQASNGSYASGMGTTDKPVSATGGSYATGMGGTTATNSSIAFGNNVKAGENGGGAFAVGMGGTSADGSSMAVGDNVSAKWSSFASGRNGTKAENGGIAYGDNVSAQYGGFAAGTNSTSASSGVAVGSNVHASDGSSYAGGMNGTTANNGSIAFGNNVHAGSSGGGAFAAGMNGTTADGSSVAVGDNVHASSSSYAAGMGGTSASSSAVAIGNNAHAYGNSYVFGSSASADSSSAAIGNSSYATNSSAAFGSSAKAVSNNSLALGSSAESHVDNGIALGSNSTAYRASGTTGLDPRTGKAYTDTSDKTWNSTYGALSIGNVDSDGTANGTRQIIGVAAGTNDTDAVNVAQLKAAMTQSGSIHDYSVNSTDTANDTNYTNAGATGKNALAAGVSAKATGDSAVAIGNGALAEGKGATVIGKNAKATGQYATAFGGLETTDKKTGKLVNIVNTASGNSATAFGQGAQARGDASLAFGHNTIAGGADGSGQQSVAFGEDTQALGGRSLAFGEKTIAKYNDSVAFGNDTRASSTGATAFGNRTRALAQYSTAWGNATVAADEESTAWGTDTIAGAKLDENGAVTNKYTENDTNKTEQMDVHGNLAYTYTSAADNKVHTAGIKQMPIDSGGEKHDYVVLAGKDGNTYVRDYQGSLWKVNVDANGNVTVDTSKGSKDKVYNGQKKTSLAKTTVNGSEVDITPDNVLIKAHEGSNGYNIDGYANATAFGYSTEASGDNATAFGNDTKATAAGATAFGYKTLASGENSTAFGESSIAAAKNSLAALGGTTTDAATNAAAIGKGAEAKLTDSIALGSGSVADRASGAKGYDMLTKGDTTNTSAAWVSNANAIAVGNGSTLTRQITGVAAGSLDTDAVNVAQLKAAGFKVTTQKNGAISSSILNGDTLDFEGENNAIVSTTKDSKTITVAVSKTPTFDSATFYNPNPAAGQNNEKVTIANGQISAFNPSEQKRAVIGVDNEGNGSLSLVNNDLSTVQVYTQNSANQGNDGITRMYYVSSSGNGGEIQGIHTIAVLDDGINYAGDNYTDDKKTDKVVVKHKLNSTMDITGGADTSNLSNNNIGVVATPAVEDEQGNITQKGKLEIKLNKDLQNLNSVTAGNVRIGNNPANTLKLTENGQETENTAPAGNYATGLDNKAWDTKNPSYVSGRAATEDQLAIVSGVVDKGLSFTTNTKDATNTTDNYEGYKVVNRQLGDTISIKAGDADPNKKYVTTNLTTDIANNGDITISMAESPTFNIVTATSLNLSPKDITTKDKNGYTASAQLDAHYRNSSLNPDKNVTMADGSTGMVRLHYHDGEGTIHDLATMDDGQIYAGDIKEDGTLDTTGFGRKMNEKTTINGGVKKKDNLTDNNIGVVSNSKDTLTVKLAKDLKDLTSVTTGKTVLNDSGIKITNDNHDESKNVVINGNKVSFGGNQVTNMGSGADDKDDKGNPTYNILTNGANIGDVKNIANSTTDAAKLTGDSNITVTYNDATADGKNTVKLNDSITLGSDVGKKVTIDGTAGTITAGDKVSLNGNTGTGSIGGVTIGNQTGVATTKTDGDKAKTEDGTFVTGLTNKVWNPDANGIVSGRAATEDQLKTVSDTVNAGWELDVNDNKQKDVTPTSRKVNFKQGQNITITGNGDDVMVATADNVRFTTINVTGDKNDSGSYTGGITIGRQSGGDSANPGPGYYITGLQNTSWNSEKIQSGRAATEDQLKQVAEDIKHGMVDGDKYITGGNATYEENGKGSAKLTGTNGLEGTISNLHDYYVTQGVVSDDGKKLTMTKNDGTTFDINLDKVMQSDMRLVKNPGSADGAYTVDNDGNLTLTVQDANGTEETKQTITLSGLASKAEVDKGLNFAANSGTDYNAKLGGKVTIKGSNAKVDHDYSDENVTTEVDASGNITIKLDKDMTANTVTVSGKDGRDGQIGITGKDGAGGTVTTIIKTIGKNGTDGKNGTPGVNGTDGITRIVYQDGKDGETGTTTHTVATLDDGLKFGANTPVVGKTANPVGNKLNSTINIKGAGTKKLEDYSGQNLLTSVEQAADGTTTINVLMDKNISADSVVVGQAGKAGKDGKDGYIGINGKDGADGITTTLIRTEKGQPGADGKTGKPGVNGTDITRIVYQNGTENKTVATLDDGLKFSGDDNRVITKKLNEQLQFVGGADKDKLTQNNIGINELEDGKLTIQLVNTPNLGEKGNLKAGDAQIGWFDGDTLIMTKDGINPSGNKADAGSYATGLSNKDWNTDSPEYVSGRAATEDQLAKVSEAINNVNTAANKRTVVTVNDKSNPAEATPRDGDYGDYDSTNGNLMIAAKKDVDGVLTYNIKLNDNLAIGQKGENGKDGKVTVDTKGGTTVVIGHDGKDGENGRDGISVKGKDGKDGVTISVSNGKDGSEGHIGLTGPAGKDVSADIHVKNGQNGVDGTDGNNGKDGMDRIVYEDHNGKLHEVATMDDGLKIGANAASKEKAANPVSNKLNSTINIMGSAAKTGHTYTDDNLTTTVEQDKDGNTTVKVLMDKDITGNSVTVGEKGESGTPGKDGVDGTIGVNGKDGSSVVIKGTDGISINGKDGQNGVTIKGVDGKAGTEGHIGLTGSKGPKGADGKDGQNASADIHVVNGHVGVDGTDGNKGTNGMDRVVYEDHNHITHEVATMDDGQKYAGDVRDSNATANAFSRKLNEQTNVVGGVTNLDDLSTGNNVGVVSNGTDTLTIRLAKKLTDLTSVTTVKTDDKGNKTSETVQDGNGITITPSTLGDGKSAVSLTDKGLSNGGNQITHVDSGLKDAAGNKVELKDATGDVLNNAVNVGDLKNVQNAVTSAHTAVTVNGGVGAPDAGANGAFGNYTKKEDGNLLLAKKKDAQTNQITYDLKLNDEVTLGKAGKDGVDGSIGLKGADGQSSIGLNGKDGISVIGKDGKNGVSITGSNGLNGKDGIDGKIAIGTPGKDGQPGKDVVSITGKDGVGHIGLTGPKGEKGADGTPGKDGISIDITTDLKSATLDDGKNVKTVIKDKDGKETTITQAPRIQYDSNGKSYEVATMDDGMKYAGDFGKGASVKLNKTVNVKGNAKKEADLTDGNIGVVSSQSGDDGQLLIKLNKDLNLGNNGSVKMGNTTINNDGMTISKTEPGKTTTVTLTDKGLDNGGNKITNVADGEISATSKDAVNGSQLNNVKTLAEQHTTVEAGPSGNVTVTPGTNADGSKKYTVDLAKDVTFGNAGNGDKTVAISGTNGTVTAGTGDNKVTVDGSKGQIVAGGDNGVKVGNIANGDSSLTIYDKDGNVTKGTDKAGQYVTNLDNKTWNADGTGSYVSGRAATEDQLHQVESNVNKQISDVNTKIDNVDKHHTEVTVNGGTHANVDGSYTEGNLQLKQTTDKDGHKIYDLKLSDNLDIGKAAKDGKDGVDGSIGLKGADGKSSIGLNGKDGISVIGADGKNGVSITGSNGKDGKNGIDGKITIGTPGKDGQPGKDAISISGQNGEGHIGLTGAAGKDGKNATADIHVKNGQVGVDGTDGHGGKDGMDRVVYEDHNGTPHEVATMDDGMKYGDDFGNTAKVKLNHQLDIVGDINAGKKDGDKKATKDDLSDGNIGIIATDTTYNEDGTVKENGKMTVKLAKDLKGLNSIESNSVTTGNTTINNSGLTIKTGDEKRNITVQDGNVNMGGNQIHNVAPGQAPGDAVNVGQLNATNQTVANLGGAVNKLGTRVNRVGAGAAALAALHPLDFDPDDKWDFAAGYGNYKDASAVAVGAYYRPNEDTMFSVGGSFGGGENMVNAGVSFKVGQGNHVSTSRVAMAKEIKDLRQDVANLNAIVNRQSALIDKLTGTNAGTIQDAGNDLFPDVPANHWAYEYVTKLKQAGILTGYPDGNFDGDRMMTRYEFAAIVYRAIMAGAASNPALSQDGTLDKLAKEFSPEMKHIRIDTIAKDKNGKPTIERVRVIPEAKQ